MFFILDIQLWVLFPRSEDASLSIVVFEILMQLFLFALFGYLYINYIEAYLHFVLPFVFFVVFITLGILLIRELKFYEYVRRMAPEGKSYAPFIRGGVAGLVIALIFALAFYASEYLLSLLGR